MKPFEASPTPVLYQRGQIHSDSPPQTDVTSSDTLGFDWVSITGKSASLVEAESLVSLADPGEVQRVPGSQGFTYQTRTPSGVQFSTGNVEGLWWVQIPGSACAALGQERLRALVADLLKLGGRCRRLDIRRDLTGPRVILIPLMLRACKRGQLKYVKHYKPFRELKATDNTVIGEGLYLGSTSSDRFTRVYDKGLQQGTMPRGKWVRFETQLRNEAAEEASTAIFNGQPGWMLVAHNRMCSAIDFRVGEGPNLDRLKRPCFWFQFCETHANLRPDLSKPQTSLESWVRWVRESAAPVLTAAAHRCGISIARAASILLDGITPSVETYRRPLVSDLAAELASFVRPPPALEPAC